MTCREAPGFLFLADSRRQPVSRRGFTRKSKKSGLVVLGGFNAFDFRALADFSYGLS